MAKATAKKKWIQIIAPKIFNFTVVGDIPALDPKTIIGKIVKVNQASLLNDMRKQNTELSLIIDNIEGDKAKTKFIGLRLLPTSLKRIVRKGRTRLDQTVKGITKDEQVVTVKVILIPRNKIKGSVFTALQEETRRFVTKRISISDYSAFSEEIVTEKLKRGLKERLSKIYPLKICDIKEFKLERFIKAVQLRKIKAGLAKEKGKKVEEEAETEESGQEAKPTEEKSSEKQEEKKSAEEKKESVEKEEEKQEEVVKKEE